MLLQRVCYASGDIVELADLGYFLLRDGFICTEREALKPEHRGRGAAEKQRGGGRH
jgi:hypothetical protein